MPSADYSRRAFRYINRQEKANAGNVTQKTHPPLKQSTLIHIQTHTYRQSYINSLKKHVRHTLNKGEDKGTALARSVVVNTTGGLNRFVCAQPRS